MKTAIVHDWLVSLGGAENALEKLVALFPGPIFTLIKNEKTLRQLDLTHTVYASFIQHLPFAQKHFRYFLPLFPSAIEQFDVSEYDLILSNSHAVAKGIKTHRDQLHICYCHTPMRYAWDLQDQYLSNLGKIKALLARAALKRLRKWDVQSLDRVDAFIGNSRFIAERIKKNYGREAAVIYPPVATHLFDHRQQKENYFITISRLVPYKRIDLIVKTFAQMPDKKLLVIGDGPEKESIKKWASPNVELLGRVPDKEMRNYLAKARAFIFAAEEDFGIVTVEAQASGTPVIAYGKGGSLEIVQNGVTGLFFNEQTEQSLREAVERFEKMSFDSERIRSNAERFSESRFNKEMKEFIDKKWMEFNESRHLSRR